MDSSLKRDLTLSLQEELRRQVGMGENVLISLPGSFGEALVVTDRRVLVIRDCDRGAVGACSTYAYALSTVKGVSSVETSSGGYIELSLSSPVSDPDQARVYYPSYEASFFQKAAEELESMLTTSKSAAVSASSSGSQTAGSCPGCGSAVGANSVYCGKCGQQLQDICPECGGASSAGSDFCSACGRKMAAFSPACHQCGARVQRWMSYCTDCGASQHQNCIACGSTIQAGWAYCGNCGRQLGTGFVDPAAARAAQRRLENFKETQREAAPAPPAVQPSASKPAASDAASYHNDRGREFFEAEDLDAAIAEFKQAIQIDPANASYHCNLAVAYDENDQDDLALMEYNRALDLDPDDVTALLSLGYMYNEQDRQDEAAEAWGRILEIAPHSPEAQEVRQNLARQDEL